MDKAQKPNDSGVQKLLRNANVRKFVDLEAEANL
jgi:hypothetical protein